MKRMSKNIILLPIIALMSLSACSGKNPVSSSIHIIDDPIFVEHQITKPHKAFNSVHQPLNEGYVNSLKAFALDFYSATANNENAIFSPLSVATCFSMLYDGALKETKEEIKAALHYTDDFNHLTEIQKMLLNNAIEDVENKTYLDIAQSLWIDDGFKDRINEEYFKKMQDYYFAEAYQGKLETDEMHQMLTDYINDKTRGFLNVKKETFDEYEGVLWLLNTIYLKAKWQYTFPEEQNDKRAFLNLDGTNTKNVEYMSNTIASHYFKAENYMISTLPYVHGLTMSILLPNEGTNYQKVLTDKDNINALLEYYNTRRNHMSAEVSYVIPKFKHQVAYDLKKVMPELGIVLAFDDDRANLFGLVEEGLAKGNLYVERSRHEAGIEVNNDGTEAAAYTVIEVDEKAVAYPEDRVNFICNRPFTYLINTSDGLPLFMGTVNKF